MVYPLPKLPYGHVYRLYQLATPSERIVINKAADKPFCPKELLPICEYRPGCTLKHELYRKIVNLSLDSMVLVCLDDLNVVGQDAKSLHGRPFSYFASFATNLRTKECVASPAFFKLLGMAASGGMVKKLSLEVTNRDGWSVMDVITNFPNVEDLWLYQTPPGWATDLLKSEKQLLFLNIADNSAFDEITTTEFSDFMKAQRSGFKLFIYQDNIDKAKNICAENGVETKVNESKKVVLKCNGVYTYYYFP